MPSLALRAYCQPALGGPELRHIGEAVALVVADDPYRAGDAAAAVAIEYEVLPASATTRRALAPNGARVFADWPDNVLGIAAGSVGDVERGFAVAEVVVEAEPALPRAAPLPIEPRGILAVPHPPDGRFTVWTSTQVPYAVRAALASVLGRSEEEIRVIAPDVGGGFGGKGHVYPEDLLIPAAARWLGRPLKWVETRRPSVINPLGVKGVGESGIIAPHRPSPTR